MPINIIDCETQGLDATGNKLILCCITNEKEQTTTHYKKKDTWQHIIQTGQKHYKNKQILTLYAHNMQYDFWNIIPRTDKNFKFYSENPFICEYKTKNNKIIFLDTMNLYKMSLKTVGNMIGHQKTEMPKELQNNQENNLNIPLIERYCKNDTITTLKAIQKIQEQLKKENINLKRLYTINQIAIQYFLKQMQKTPKPYLFKNQKTLQIHFPKNKRMIHDAYRGGRCECFKTGKYQGVTYIDCNNLYGHSAINIKFPDLRTEQEIKYPLNIYTTQELLDKIGISKIAIKNNTNQIGLLPIRTTTTSYYPTTNTIIIGTYTHQEIKEAINNGYELIDIEKSVVWEEAPENPYKEFIPHLYKSRKESRTPFENYFYKQMMNSGFGKLAQTRIEQEILIDSIEKAQQYLNKGYTIIKSINYNYMYKKHKETKQQKKYYCPIIPTLINAQARIHMHKHYQQIGIKNILYTDTDSILFTGQIPQQTQINQKIGGFKLEHYKKSCILWGRKTYRIDTQIKISGIHKAQIKPEQFEKGYITHTKMINLNDTTDINEVGLFKQETRDLTKQQEELLKTQTTLQKKRIYIDQNINDITYFLPKLKKHTNST